MMIFQKIRTYTKKAFSSKRWVIGIINRFMDKSLGRVDELLIDREAKHIFLEFISESGKSRVNIKNYSIEYQGNRAFVLFRSIEVEGYLKSRLKQTIKEKRIEVDPKYFTLLKKLLKS